MNRREAMRWMLGAAGGLVVGDAALEAFERMTHRKVWALGAMPYTVTPDHWYEATYVLSGRELAWELARVRREMDAALVGKVAEFTAGMPRGHRQAVEDFARHTRREQRFREFGQTMLRVDIQFGRPT